MQRHSAEGRAGADETVELGHVALAEGELDLGMPLGETGDESWHEERRDRVVAGDREASDERLTDLAGLVGQIGRARQQLTRGGHDSPSGVGERQSVRAMAEEQLRSELPLQVGHGQDFQAVTVAVGV